MELVLLAAIFTFLWCGLSLVMRRTWLRLVVCTVGTVLAGIVVLLVLWEQATGS